MLFDSPVIYANERILSSAFVDEMLINDYNDRCDLTGPFAANYANEWIPSSALQMKYNHSVIVMYMEFRYIIPAV